jgi:hypothetical protein
VQACAVVFQSDEECFGAGLCGAIVLHTISDVT